MNNLHLETLALHAGYTPKEHNNASTVPIYQTVAYEYNSAAHAANLFALEEFGPGLKGSHVNGQIFQTCRNLLESDTDNKKLITI